MNKKAILAWIILFSVIPVLSLAATPPRNQIQDLSVIINNIIDVIWKAFIGFSIVMFLVAAFMFLTAQGDPTKLKTARSAFIWGVVGVGVAIVGFSVANIISSALTTPPNVGP